MTVGLCAGLAVSVFLNRRTRRGFHQLAEQRLSDVKRWVETNQESLEPDEQHRLLAITEDVLLDFRDQIKTASYLYSSCDTLSKDVARSP